MEATSRPARSRPVQKTLPLARISRTRAEGFVASKRSKFSMASSIAPVTRFPSAGLSSVKVRISPARSSFKPAGVSVLGEFNLSDCRPPPGRHNNAAREKDLEFITKLFEGAMALFRATRVPGGTGLVCGSLRRRQPLPPWPQWRLRHLYREGDETILEFARLGEKTKRCSLYRGECEFL